MEARKGWGVSPAAATLVFGSVLDTVLGTSLALFIQHTLLEAN